MEIGQYLGIIASVGVPVAGALYAGGTKLARVEVQVQAQAKEIEDLRSQLRGDREAIAVALGEIRKLLQSISERLSYMEGVSDHGPALSDKR